MLPFYTFENVQQVKNFKENLNSQHFNIKFTFEIEMDNSLDNRNPHLAEFLRIMKAL